MKNTWKWVLGGGVIAVIVVAVVMANPQFQKGELVVNKLAAPALRPALLPQNGNCTNVWSPILSAEIPVIEPHDAQFNFTLREGTFENVSRAVENGCDLKISFRKNQSNYKSVYSCSGLDSDHGGLNCYSTGKTPPGVLLNDTVDPEIGMHINPVDGRGEILMRAVLAIGGTVFYEPPAFFGASTVTATIFAKK